MNQALQSRLRRLEKIVRAQQFEQKIDADLEEWSDQIAVAAAEIGVTPEYLRNEIRETLELKHKLGDDAYYRYMAKELDVPLQTMMDPVKRAAWIDETLESIHG